MKRRAPFWGLNSVLSALVVVLVGAAVVWPAVTVLREARGGGEGADLGLLTRSVGVATLIAVLATALAWPAAWLVRGARGPTLVLLMAPMLLPAYLSYTGWGVLRAPDSVIGKWLMMGPRGEGPGGNWYPAAAGYVLAVSGLALWASPLAGLIVGVRLRRVDDEVLESLRVDAGRKRWIEVVRMSRGAIGAAAGIVILVMLGSAVPLHLAQLDTYAIKLWRLLDQTARAEQGKVWGSAWPLLLIAAAGGAVISRRFAGVDSQEVPTRRLAGRGMWAMAGVVGAMAVVAPMVILGVNVRQWRGFGAFLGLIREPVQSSVVVGAWVGVVTVMLAVWMWVLVGGAGSGRRCAALVGGVFVATGLVPGILVGAATARAWAGPAVSWVGDSELIVVLAHVARFGVIGVAAGWWLAVTEGTSIREQRIMDAGGSLRGWVEAALAPQAGVILAAAVGAGLMSFHEIESTVLVQPPSASGGAFAWQMLQWLHFARMDDLGMGVLLVVGFGVAAGVVMAIGVRISKR